VPKFDRRLGLTPKKYQSGQTDYTGRISRHGDASAREALCEAAHLILTKPIKGCSELKSWATRIARRAGANKAKVALARKLAVIMLRMLKDNAPFNPVPRQLWSKTRRTNQFSGGPPHQALPEAKSAGTKHAKMRQIVTAGKLRMARMRWASPRQAVTPPSYLPCPLHVRRSSTCHHPATTIAAPWLRPMTPASKRPTLHQSSGSPASLSGELAQPHSTPSSGIRRRDAGRGSASTWIRARP
jgi:Transposase IS116/IS110/IS902 family